jgi:putative acetyltransferase
VTGAIAVTIRPEQAADQESIRLLNLAAFGGPEEAQIVDEVRGSEDWLPDGSLVALDQSGDLVGHVLLSRGWVADGPQRWPAGMVGPVAVAPRVQRRGVGSLLMRAAIARAEELKLPVLCLLGHADYYPRFGFRPARSLGIEPPQDWTDENWLALPLTEWQPEVRGKAGYPKAFGVG